MTDRLSLYNGALRLVGESRLTSLTEAAEKCRLLDDAWDDNAIRYCLEQGYWWFATRASRFDPDPDFTASFGYQYGYEKPTDWIRTAGTWADDRGNVPLTRIRDEAGYWFADVEPIYISYISSDVRYGMNLANWPETFTQYVESYLAFLIAPKLTNDLNRVAMVEKLMSKRRVDARSKAAMNEAAGVLPMGSWTASRMRRIGSDNARGRLIG